MKYCGYEFSAPTQDLSLARRLGGCVYLIIVNGGVEYVGATSNLYRRICEHKCRKFKGVDFEFSFVFDTYNLIIEQDIIDREKPPRNIMLSNKHERKIERFSLSEIAKKILKVK